MLTPSLPTEAATGLPLSARRRIQAGMVVASAAGVPRTGLLTVPAAPLVTGTADSAMTYRIGPFVGASSRDGVGVEFAANDASDTVGTDIAPGANSRIDVIWWRCRFPSLTDAGQTAPTFGVTRGVANANPQKPAIPPGAEELATAVVTSADLATQTVVITQTARYTAYAGGTVPVRNQAELNAWTPVDGAEAIRLDTGVRYRRLAGVWRPVAPARHNGLSGIGISGIDVPQQAIDLPAGLTVKTGMLTSGTTVRDGNEYFPTVLFEQPYPTAALSVMVTPIYKGAVNGPPAVIGIDTLNTGGFQPLIKGSATGYVRSFLWTAYGY